MPRNDGWFTLREGALIRHARKEKQETQEALAEYMEVDVRTVRNWESGKTTLTDWHRRQNLAAHLSISLETFNTAIETDFTVEEAQKELLHAKNLFDTGKFTSAYAIGDRLLTTLTRQVKKGETSLMPELACSLYFAGHAASIAENDPPKALSIFKQLEDVARELQNDDWLCLALTYQGEMYRRLRKNDQAIEILTNVPQGPGVDVYIRGNRAQLLARAYGKSQDWKKAERLLGEAKELASQEEKRTSDIYVCYSLCGVYEEYARLFMHNAPQRSLHYMQLAKKYAPSAPRWRIPLLLTEGEILLRAVGRAEVREPKRALHEPDYEIGKKLILKAIHLAREGGHKRQEWHATRLPQRFQREQAILGIIAQDLEEGLKPQAVGDPGDDY